MDLDEDSLDAEFKKLLCIIRQYIPYINSNSCLSQCRLWLEKLSSTENNKESRNWYLGELCRQIQANRLHPPFTDAPPSGCLTKEEKSQKSFRKSSVKSVKNGSDQTVDSQYCYGDSMDNDTSWSDLSEASVNQGQPIKTRNKKKTTLNKEFKQAESNLPLELGNLPLDMYSKLLKDTNYISQDWKKTIGALQLRLSEITQQNNELKTSLQNMEENQLKEQNLNTQEIAKLQEAHAINILQLRNSLSEEYQTKLDRISRSYEDQLVELKSKTDHVLARKDKEIFRLSEIIQDQCLRIMNDISALKTLISNCSCDKKVHVLKKCVSKMEKSFQRSEKEYLKQIEHLRQELDLKENTLQVQLKLQKAELIAQTRTGQKEEFEEILNSLEVKYIKMLEAHEHQIMKMKKQDDAKIHHLTELLEKHGIPYSEN